LEEGCPGAGLAGEATGALIFEVGVAQATSMPTIATLHSALSIPNILMLPILLESLGAGLLLALIVWWTMFHGRKEGELGDKERQDDKTDKR
jgi:hypothetical protein